MRLEKERELERLESEAEEARQQQVKEATEEVRRRHAQGAQTTEELERDLVNVIGAGDPEAVAKLEAAKQARRVALEAAKKQLKEQHAAANDELKKEKMAFDKELDTSDLLQAEQAEKARIEALKKAGLFDEREREREAEKQKDRVHRISQDVDTAMQASALLE